MGLYFSPCRVEVVLVEGCWDTQQRLQLHHAHLNTFIDLCRLRQELGSNVSEQNHTEQVYSASTDRYFLAHKWHLQSSSHSYRSHFQRPFLWMANFKWQWWWLRPVACSKLTGCLCEKCKRSVYVPSAVSRRWVSPSCETLKMVAWTHHPQVPISSVILEGV